MDANQHESSARAVPPRFLSYSLPPVPICPDVVYEKNGDDLTISIPSPGIPSLTWTAGTVLVGIGGMGLMFSFFAITFTFDFLSGGHVARRDLLLSWSGGVAFSTAFVFAHQWYMHAATRIARSPTVIFLSPTRLEVILNGQDTSRNFASNRAAIRYLAVFWWGSRLRGTILLQLKCENQPRRRIMIAYAGTEELAVVGGRLKALLEVMPGKRSGGG